MPTTSAFFAISASSGGASDTPPLGRGIRCPASHVRHGVLLLSAAVALALGGAAAHAARFVVVVNGAEESKPRARPEASLSPCAVGRRHDGVSVVTPTE